HRSRLPVDLGAADGEAELVDRVAETEHEPGHTVAAEDRPRPGRRLAAAVAVDHRVCGEQPDQALHVPVADRVEEPRRELLALSARSLEARLLLLDVAPGAGGE